MDFIICGLTIITSIHHGDYLLAAQKFRVTKSAAKIRAPKQQSRSGKTRARTFG